MLSIKDIVYNYCDEIRPEFIEALQQLYPMRKINSMRFITFDITTSGDYLDNQVVSPDVFEWPVKKIYFGYACGCGNHTNTQFARSIGSGGALAAPMVIYGTVGGVATSVYGETPPFWWDAWHFEGAANSNWKFIGYVINLD